MTGPGFELQHLSPQPNSEQATRTHHYELTAKSPHQFALKKKEMKLSHSENLKLITRTYNNSILVHFIYKMKSLTK